LVHWTIGTISMPVLTLLLAGGIPGVIVGCIVARKVPAQKLKAVVALIAIFAGLQLVWSGAHTLAMQNGQNVSKLLPEFAKKAQP